MTIGIVGTGSLGTLFAEALSRVTRVEVLGRAGAPARLAEARVVLVVVKTYDTSVALRQLRDVLSPDAAIVSLQNGVLQVAQIEAALGPERQIVLAPTTEAATREPGGGVRRGGIGSTVLGIPAGRPGTNLPDVLAELFRSAGLAAEAAAPIEPHLWAKLVVNAAINPVATWA